MNLRGLDLNLLVILDALLDEAHVSRAAERVGLSQPAASNALARCRTLFGDQLLVRAGGGLRRTPLAERLRGPLRESLAWVSHVVDRTPPDIRKLRQTVRVAMADHPAAVVVAPVLERLRQSAPGIDLVLHPWHGSEDIERLRRGEMDLAASVVPPSGEEFRVKALGTIRAEVVMRRRHPAAQDFSLQRWLEYPHLMVSDSGENSGAVDAALARIGKARRVAAVVPNYLLALQLVSQTDMMAFLPTAMLPARLADNLASFEAPIEIEPDPLFLLRHRRSDGDVAVEHVAQLLEDAASDFK